MISKNYIEVGGLSCSYDSKRVLRRVNFRISSNEALAIVGRSGSGKTTLAYCLTGIIPHKIKADVDGEILLNGVSYRELGFHEITNNINIVLEDYESQIFGLTVEEELAFGLENLGLPRMEISGRINWALETFDLYNQRRMLVSELSGGLKQRLAIASTVILKPHFLILDNPTANLDWSGVLKLKKTVMDLKSSGCGLILLLRKIKGFEDCLDKVFILHEGLLQNVNPRYIGFPSLLPSSRSDANKAPNKFDTKPVISVEDVWFKYDVSYVLKGVSLNVHERESLTVMGSNGSGKTTLIKHLNGLLKPDRGRIIVCGRDTRHFTAASMAELVGLAFQDPDKHLFAETVWDEVSFGCKVLNLSIENAVRALRFLGIYDLRDRFIHELSMGEKVRVVIASALALDPKILVLDEPTTGQDVELLRELANLIFKLKSNGKSVVVVTHDSDFALAVADRVAVMVDGKIKYTGPPAKVLFDNEVLGEACLEPPYRLIFSEVTTHAY